MKGSAFVTKINDDKTNRDSKKKKKETKSMALKKPQLSKPNRFESIRSGGNSRLKINPRRKTRLRDLKPRDKSSSIVFSDINDVQIYVDMNESQSKGKERSNYNLSDGEQDDIEFQILCAIREVMLPDDESSTTARRSYQLNSGDMRDRDLNVGNENDNKTHKENA